MAAGFLSLAGFWLNIPQLVTWAIAPVKIAANTAGCFVPLGVSLFLQINRERCSLVRDVVAKSAAALVALTALLSLAEFFWGLDFHIDNLLAVARPNLMSPVTAVNFLLLGAALLLLNWRTKHEDWPAQYLSVGAAIGAIFGGLPLILESHAPRINISLPAAVTFFVAAVSLVLSRADWAIGGLLVGGGAGARLLRRIIPAALLTLSLVVSSVSNTLMTMAHLSWALASVLAILFGTGLAGTALWMSFIVDRSELQNARLERHVAERTAALHESEGRLASLNRKLRAISNCNQVLLRATDEQSLIGQICGIICDEAGYRMAWVGYAQNDDVKSICPVAWAGFENGCLAEIDIRWSEDTECGRGPAGTAIRNGKTHYSQDLASDANFAWREAALERGYCSAIALPLTDEHAGVFGVLTIYSTEPNAFSPEEIQLLEQLAADLAFGITVIRARIERERVEKTLALRSFALNSVREAALLIDEQGRFRDVNEECCRFLGYSREQLLEMRVSDLDPEMPTERSPERWALLKAQRSLTFERLFRSKEGRIANVEVCANYFEYGGAAYNLALARDITARKEAEDQLRNSEQRLALLIEQSPLGFLGWDTDSRLTEWNPAAERIFGFTREEVLGRDMAFLVPDSARESVYERVREVQREKIVIRGTNQNLAKDGRIILCDWCNSPLIDSQGRVIGAIAICEDVTAERTLEEQLRQAQKMQAIGQLAGGVAHDFNNILGVINGYSEFLLSERDLKEAHRESIEEILAAGERAASLTRQLLAFSRKLLIQPKVLNLNFVLEGFDKMLRRLIGDEIEVRTVLDPKLSAVNADPSQMEQVLLNFCINARDAMPDGGQITIETENVHLNEATAAQHSLLIKEGHFTRSACGDEFQPGRYVRLSVSDTGIGMDQETQSHIFEPFFTTKGPERGTGLGLATVYGIVKQNGGHVVAHSEPGQGTTFRVYLPAVSQEITERWQISTPREPLRGTETVLLVEDDKLLRTLCRKLLEDRGYTVLEAGDGEHAIKVAELYQGELALLLTDVSLPKVKGPALARILLQQRPTLKVLFMSGHGAEIVSEPGYRIPAGTNFIPKPFGLEELLKKLRETLNSQQPEGSAC
jgi:PAS domain S-box-containing protein